MKNPRYLLLATTVLVAACFAQSAVAQSATTMLPVYEVTTAGATEAQAVRLSDALKTPVELVSVSNGAISFIDADKFIYVPHLPVPNTGAEAIDFESVNRLEALQPVVAVSSVSKAFAAAGFHLENAKPVISHTIFTASYTNEKGTVVSVNKPLDTRVSYAFTQQDGTPLIGPGAQVEVTFGPAGDVTHLRYALRELKPGPSVQILSASAVRNRIVKSLSANARVDLRLVYWAPSFEPGPGRAEPLHPTIIIPWYAYNVITPVSGPVTGRPSELRSKERLIPATDDPRYVPSARLEVFGRGETVVAAQVTVTGGRAPYSYIWAGSNPQVSASVGFAVRYTPIVRGVPPDRPGAQTLANETVSVRVIDANGVAVEASEIVPVLAQIVAVTNDQPTPAGKDKGRPTYGTESPREPAFAVDRVGWQNGMSSSSAGGGSQRYAWLGANAWPGDFIEPSPKGSLPAMPWVNGDADYANWGINTATIVLNNTDGDPDGFASSQPGALIANYATAQLFLPSTTASTVVVGQIDYGNVPGTQYYNIDYDGSWGSGGPDDHLIWLAMDACDILDANDNAGLTPQQRWGKAFGGLHILTGWNSEESVGDGSFEQDFAQNMLGVSGQAQTVLNAWFNAATIAGTDHGLAAAMGPIGPGGVDDTKDYYLGKGSQGPTILPADIKGFWYVHQ